ncbi:hypothetical protein PQX77_022072, partial [Marasmius sp. AFHP31]
MRRSRHRASKNYKVGVGGARAYTQATSRSFTNTVPEEERARENRALEAALNYRARDILLESESRKQALTNEADEEDWMDVNNSLPPPPGEEGIYLSHAGGEGVLINHAGDDEEAFISLLQTQAGDTRTRREVLEKQNHSWGRQLKSLVDGYLKFRDEGPPETNEATWAIPVMDYHNHHNVTLCHPASSSTINETLALNGMLGGSPEQPNIAFTFAFLDAFRQIHRVCPRYSIEGLARSLQYIHRLPRDPQLERQLRTTYDAYLMIVQEVRRRQDKALGRDSRLAYYESVELKPSMLIAMDGNNSLKLVDPAIKSGSVRLDTRELKDPRWLEVEQVDEMKDEVANAQQRSNVRGKKQQETASNPKHGGSSSAPNSAAAHLSFDPECSHLPVLNSHEDVAWLNVVEQADEVIHEHDGATAETEELLKGLDVCVDRWRAA